MISVYGHIQTVDVTGLSVIVCRLVDISLGIGYHKRFSSVLIGDGDDGICDTAHRGSILHILGLTHSDNSLIRGNPPLYRITGCCAVKVHVKIFLAGSKTDATEQQNEYL